MERKAESVKINFVDANCSMAFLLNILVKQGVAYS